MCLKTCSNLICNASDQFHKEIQNICRRGLGTPKTQNLVISRCCLAENGNEMYKDLQRTCTTIVLPIKPLRIRQPYFVSFSSSSKKIHTICNNRPNIVDPSYRGRTIKVAFWFSAIVGKRACTVCN